MRDWQKPSRSSAELFISKFCQWARDVHACRARSLRRLPSVLRRMIDVELPARDGHVEIVARNLGDSPLRLGLQLDDQWLIRSHNQLWVVTVAPDWGSGWTRLTQDEDLHDLLSNFFRLASQYVARSRAANILGAVAMVYRQPLDFRFGDFRKIRVEPTFSRRWTGVAQKLGLPVGTLGRHHGRRRAVAVLAAHLNCLQPHVHRMVFQYLRALKLKADGYDEEFITALDGAVSVALQFARDVLGEAAAFDRNDLARKFLHPSDATALALLYDLRCYFGAHPSQGKWWDFGEMYEEELDVLLDVAERLVRGVALTDHHSGVDPRPASWSGWFKTNCLLLWNAVWFDGLPRSILKGLE